MSNMGAIGLVALYVGGAALAGTVLGPVLTIGSTKALSTAADFFGRRASKIHGDDAVAETGYKIAEWTCRAFAVISAIGGSVISGISAGGLLLLLSPASPAIALFVGAAVATILGAYTLRH
jgi:hypothetical protein